MWATKSCAKRQCATSAAKAAASTGSASGRTFVPVPWAGRESAATYASRRRAANTAAATGRPLDASATNRTSGRAAFVVSPFAPQPVLSESVLLPTNANVPLVGGGLNVTSASRCLVANTEVATERSPTVASANLDGVEPSATVQSAVKVAIWTRAFAQSLELVGALSGGRARTALNVSSTTAVPMTAAAIYRAIAFATHPHPALIAQSGTTTSETLAPKRPSTDPGE